MRVSMLLLAVILGACVSAEPQITGPYACRLSPADVAEIRTVTASHLAHVHLRAADSAATLEVLRPDYVQVTAPILDRTSSGAAFHVMKRRGHWIVDGHGGGVGGLAKGENVVVE